jgi:hypothetical protein
MARHAANWHHNSVARRLGVGPCGQSLLSRRPCYPTTRIQSPPTSVVSSKPFLSSTGPVQSLPQTMRPLWLRRDSDSVSHCRGQSPYKVRRRSTGAAQSWRGRCQGLSPDSKLGKPQDKQHNAHKQHKQAQSSASGPTKSPDRTLKPLKLTIKVF